MKLDCFQAFMSYGLFLCAILEYMFRNILRFYYAVDNDYILVLLLDPNFLMPAGLVFGF